MAKFNLKKTIGLIGAAVAAAGGVFLAEKAGECTSGEKNALPTLEPIDQKAEPKATEPDGESETKSEETEG